MKIIADMHCHTVASTHAYSSLTEVVQAAADIGLLGVAITDHGKTMPGAPGRWYFSNLKVVPERLCGIRVFRGIETNIIDFDGNLDEEDKTLNDLDWVIASMHGPTMAHGTAEDYTNAYLAIAENPLVHVIGHPGGEAFRFDYERVLPIFRDKGKIVEINSHSFSARKGSAENCREIAKICMKYDVPVIVNSDAHFHTVVGDVSEALAMLESIGFPEDLIVNSSRERLNAYLNKYVGICL